MSYQSPAKYFNLRITMKSYLSLLLVISFSFVFSSCVTAADADDEDESLPHVELKAVKDLSLLAEQAREDDKIILLEVTASYCSYCALLEEEIIKPMLRSGDYKKTVLIRQLEMDSFYPVKDFAGNDTTLAELAIKYKVKLTPTLLFLDANGNEVAERILGVYSLDFFGFYVDEALTKGLKRIRKN